MGGVPVKAATWSGSGDGETRWFVGTLAIVRVSGQAGDGRFALIEVLLPPPPPPPRPPHPQDESYVVLAGRLTVVAGDQRFVVEAGGVAVVPIGVVHTF